MKCEICGIRDATVHYTEMKENEVRKLHLCEECAQEKGFRAEVPSGESSSAAGFLGSMAEEALEIPGSEEGGLACPSCGLTYTEFRRSARLGCADCYRAFRKPIVPLLRRIHGNERHIGKTLSQRGEEHQVGREIRALKRKLEECVQREDFEEAARLRDRIRSLEEGDA